MVRLIPSELTMLTVSLAVSGTPLLQLVLVFQSDDPGNVQFVELAAGARAGKVAIAQAAANLDLVTLRRRTISRDLLIFEFLSRKAASRWTFSNMTKPIIKEFRYAGDAAYRMQPGELAQGSPGAA